MITLLFFLLLNVAPTHGFFESASLVFHPPTLLINWRIDLRLTTQIRVAARRLPGRMSVERVVGCGDWVVGWRGMRNQTQGLSFISELGKRVGT
jgi:hypothetical protein